MSKIIRFTIRTKLLIMSVVSIAVAVATLGIFLSISFANSAYQTAINTLQSVSTNATQALESTVSSAESSMVLLSNQIGYNDDFANYILTATTRESKDHLTKALAGDDRSGDGSTIIGAMDYMVISDPDIESATMYSPFMSEGDNIYSRLYHTSKSKIECTTERYNALIEHSGKSFWFFEENDDEHIYVWKALVNFGVDDNYDMQVVGYIEYVLNREKFFVCLSDTLYEDEGMALVNEEGRIVMNLSSQNETVDNEIYQNIGSLELGIKRRNNYTTYKTNIKVKQWTYISYIHHKSISQTIRNSTILTAIIIGASVFVAALVSYLLAAREVNRIKRLSKAAGEISSGNYEVRLKKVANDEITDMSESFNVMAGRVQDVLQELILQQDSISENFATILSNKSGESGNHVKRVSEYSAILANELGFNDNDTHDIRIGSMLHDVGKIMVDESILHKPGRFTDEEYKIMQKHVDFGGQLLKGVPGNIMQLGAIIAQYHHERWDGNGYTQGLKGDEIPVEAQIASVADVFDALVSRRCYKDAWTIEQARDEIISQSGKQFSPKVVEAFERRFDDFVHIANIYKE